MHPCDVRKKAHAKQSGSDATEEQAIVVKKAAMKHIDSLRRNNDWDPTQEETNCIGDSQEGGKCSSGGMSL